MLPGMANLRPSDGVESSPEGPRLFVTTHWSVVLAAGQGVSPGAQAALEKLCRTYWYSLYAYVRREGYNATEAQDLTQGFFARLLAKDYLGQVEPQKGKFRSFLLAALRHFLSDQRDRDRALKRGGGADCFPWTHKTRRSGIGSSPSSAWTLKRSMSAAGR